MTILIRIEPDLAGQFHLVGSSKMPDGNQPIDIKGATFADIRDELARQLDTNELIVRKRDLPSRDIQ